MLKLECETWQPNLKYRWRFSQWLTPPSFPHPPPSRAQSQWPITPFKSWWLRTIAAKRIHIAYQYSKVFQRFRNTKNTQNQNINIADTAQLLCSSVAVSRQTDCGRVWVHHALISMVANITNIGTSYVTECVTVYCTHLQVARVYTLSSWLPPLKRTTLFSLTQLSQHNFHWLLLFSRHFLFSTWVVTLISVMVPVAKPVAVQIDRTR